MDKYIEIWFNEKRNEFDINIRWLAGEQHEVYVVETIAEVNEIVNNFYKDLKMEGPAG